MTRFLKTSLCVVALLLVTMLVLTGCGHSKLEESIGNAQGAADQAQADAAANLATAKQSVEEARASLEAAIATKADATTLAAEVSKLNAAIEAAKAVASTADGALKVELEAAIAAAKATILAEGENLVRELDAEILELLNDTDADVADVKAKVDALSKMIEEMDTIAGFKASFTLLTGDVAANRFLLDARYEELVACGLYTADQLDILARAYKIADTAIIRATSLSVIEQAWTAFEGTVLSDEVRNPVDTLYVLVTDAHANGFEEGMAEAKALFVLADGYAKDSAKAALTRDYYGKGDLLEASLDLYVAEVQGVVSELGDRYIVYPEALQAEDAAAGKVAISGAQDKADLENARTYLNDVTTAVDTLAITEGVDPFVVSAFVANEARMTLLATAKADAESVVALDKGYGEANNAAVALEQTIINDINAWDKAVDTWIAKYFKAVDDTASAANQQRAALLYDLIEATEDARDTDKAVLDELAEAYKQSAFELFQQTVSEFYNIYATDIDTLQHASGIDYSKLNFSKKSTLDEAWAGYQTWLATYEGKANLYGIYGTNEAQMITVSDSITDLLALYNKYEELAKIARDAYPAELDETVADVMPEDIDKINDALKWFTDYAVWNNGAIIWDTVRGEAAYNISADDPKTQPAVIVTKAYYDRLVAIKAMSEKIATDKAAKALELNNAINALAVGNDLKLSHAQAVANARTLYDAYINATYVAEANRAQYVYNAADTANNDRFAFTVADTQLAKLEASETRIAALQAKLNEIDEKTAELKTATEGVGVAYPFFAEAVADNAAGKTAYETIKNELKTLVAEFEDAANNGGDDAFNTAELADAKAAIKTAQQNLARDTIFGLNYELGLLTAKLNAAYPYFEDAEGKVTEAAYKAALNTLLAAIPQNTNDLSDVYDGLTNAEVYALVSPVVQADILAARTVLAKDLVYDEVAKLEAITVNGAYPFFGDAADNVAKRGEYEAQKNAIKTALDAGYEGVIVDWADVQDAKDAYDAAIELIVRDIVGQYKAALDASATVTEGYGHFASEADKNNYKAAAQDLRNAIFAEDTGYEAIVGNTTNVADIIAALEAAELKVAKYEAFEGFYTVKYNLAVEVINADADLDADAKTELLGKVEQAYLRYREVVDNQSVAEITDETYKIGFVATLNSALETAGVDPIA